MRRAEAVAKLSKREIECLRWAAFDKTVKETSKLMCLSPETVKGYRNNALNKTGFQTITGAVSYAIKYGILGNWNI